MSVFVDRMVRAARLDVTLYEEVEADRGAMGQAIGVVVLSSLAAGIGSAEWLGLAALAAIIISSLIGWFVWAYITYFIGVKFFPEPQTRADHGELLRTIGFSSSPGLIMIAGIIPGLGALSYFIASVWMLVAMIVAVRQALDYSSTMRAVLVCMVGWFVKMALMFILTMLL